MNKLPEHLQEIVRNTSPEKWERICRESREKFNSSLGFKTEEISLDEIFGETK